MKAIRMSIATLATLLVMPVGGYTQRLGSETPDRLDRLDSDTTRIPESPSTAPLHRHKNSTPQSHIPPRSPDLGEPYFPLSPSIGPGSGLLGPEAGRAPARLRSGGERGSRGIAQ
jgi:hypothetical protein